MVKDNIGDVRTREDGEHDHLGLSTRRKSENAVQQIVKPKKINDLTKGQCQRREDQCIAHAGRNDMPEFMPRDADIMLTDADTNHELREDQRLGGRPVLDQAEDACQRR